MRSETAIAEGRVRGRSTDVNPANRFESHHLEVLPEHLERERIDHPEGLQVRTETVADRTGRVLNRVDSPDLPFRWTLNPYRGCEHGCIYCYARPTHELLGYSCGLDFETRIVVKSNAPQLLFRELADERWVPETIVMSGVTDPYQPVESRLGITRECLEVLAECRHPVSLVTKSRLIGRDVDLLARLAEHNAAQASISLTTLDPRLARIMEPRASRPADRLEAISRLTAEGVPVQVLIAPIIPGLNDKEVPALLEAAAAAGARHAQWMLVRLPHQVRMLFVHWLRSHLPQRADRILGLIRELRDGQLSDARFGHRHRGSGPIAESLDSTFRVFAARQGLDTPLPPLSAEAFRRPALDGQLGLFEKPE